VQGGRVQSHMMRRDTGPLLSIEGAGGGGPDP
jgi:hypothetical protein